jgi:hypothetical protein
MEGFPLPLSKIQQPFSDDRFMLGSSSDMVATDGWTLEKLANIAYTVPVVDFALLTNHGGEALCRPDDTSKNA